MVLLQKNKKTILVLNQIILLAIKFNTILNSANISSLITYANQELNNSVINAAASRP
jgi:hypothetical protein